MDHQEKRSNNITTLFPVIYKKNTEDIEEYKKLRISRANVVYKEVLLQEDFINDNQDQNLQKVMEEFEGQGD